MGVDRYDFAVVGGGLGGAAFGKAMAERGANVLVLERTPTFTDRIRGEWIAPWGVEELKELGLYDEVMGQGGHALPGFTISVGLPGERRDLVASARPGLPAVSFYHPDAQEAVLASASSAGAAVERGASVRSLRRTSDGPVLSVRSNKVEREVSARLVVGADGRDSAARRWAGFELRRFPETSEFTRDFGTRFLTGQMFEDVDADATAGHMWVNPAIGSVGYYFPHSARKGRAFVVFGERSQSPTTPDELVKACRQAGANGAMFATAKPIGLFATIAASDGWVDHPYGDGVVLIGDAAGATDPTWGQGMSTTLRDVRLLRDALSSEDELDRACHDYAEAHDQYWRTVLTLEEWSTTLLLKTGTEADANRERAIDHWNDDQSRRPDVFMSGPDGYVLDEQARRRYFGEE